MLHRKLFDFLCLDYIEIPEPLKQTNPFPIYKQIDNYGEVKDYLESKGY